VTRVTLRTVARQVGVSPMTVSNAFSRPDQLSAALREKILAAAAELGYAGPDPAARTLARGSTGTVGILFHGTPRHTLSDDLVAPFLAAVAEELARDGLALTLLPNLGTPDVEPVRDVAMDGAIIYSCSPVDEHVEWLRRRQLPLVLVDQPPDDRFPSVNVADRAGACAAATHLVEFGHRRIALLAAAPERVLRHRDPRHGAYGGVSGSSEAVANPDDRYVPRERLRGWRDALGPAGITPVPRYVERSGGEAAYAAARELLAAPDRPTAVLAFSDTLAADVLRAAADLRLRVPADVSVIGFDDSRLARRLTPALTTVRQDAVAKGSTAAAELVAAIRARRVGDAAPARHHLLATELVLRDTTAPPADAVGGTNGTFVG
jgi:DNA-binding LacI/PurR family transcriptional regulator